MFKLNLFIKFLLLISPLIFFNFSQAELKINDEEYIPLSEAKWKVRPNISYPDSMEECMTKKNISIITRLIVNIDGKVVETTLLKSSGNRTIDIITLHQLRKAEFYPFIKNGKPVVGSIVLPIQIDCK